MPSSIQKPTSDALQHRVISLSRQLRQRRKAMGVTVQNAAAAAGMSRDTWYRMERGEASVTIGAWFNALAVLGFRFGIGLDTADPARSASASIPLEIPLAEFPQLAALAWQISDRAALSPREAHDIYERNARHLDVHALEPEEQALIAGLRRLFG